MTKGFKKLSQPDFNLIKTLTEAGLSIKQIREITGRSDATISNVRRSETLLDYRRLNEKYRNARKSQQQAEEQVSSTEQTLEFAGVEPSEDLGTPIGVISDSYSLVRIADALERLADAWEAAPNKKPGLFNK